MLNESTEEIYRSNNAAAGALVGIYREDCPGKDGTKVIFARYLLSLWSIERNVDPKRDSCATAT